MQWINPLKIIRNMLNMKNIGTKSVNMSGIMVYLAMFSTTIDKILCFMGPHKMKMSHYFSVLDPIWILGIPNPMLLHLSAHRQLTAKFQ